MNCARFAEWLDEGRPGETRDVARRHAEGCPRCAAELVAARELDALLGARHESAPADFADRVIARLPARDEAPARAALLAEADVPDLPWWSRALMEPTVVLSLMLAALLAAGGGPLLTRGEWIAEAGRRIPGLLAGPLGWVVSLPVLPVVAVGLTGLAALTWGLWVAGLRLGAAPLRR